MNKQKQLNYIMTEIGWMDALLADIRSLIKGSLRFKNTYSYLLDGSCGAGNVSIPMLICTGLELASALYTGRTEYNMGRKNTKPCYDANKNVKEFIIQYFPDPIKSLTHIFWDAIRNGTHHLFIPKSMVCYNKQIQFVFYMDKVGTKSHVTKSKSGNKIIIKINSIEFYRIFKKAFEKYKAEITTTPKLRKKFMLAWRSIKPGGSIIRTEWWIYLATEPIYVKGFGERSFLNHDWIGNKIMPVSCASIIDSCIITNLAIIVAGCFCDLSLLNYCIDVLVSNITLT